MTAQTFLLPDLGEGLTEAVIVKWLVAVGDTITTDQAIAEVETAKSIVELPSPFSGTVLELHGAEGETVATGSPVLVVGDPGDSVESSGSVGSGNSGSGEDQAPASGAADASARPAADAPAAEEVPAPGDRVEAEAYRAEERAGSGNVLIGYGTESVATKGRRRRRHSPAEPASLQAAGTKPGAPRTEPAAVNGGTPKARTVAVRSPIVRRLAKELGIDPRTIPATGSDGAVTRADVLRAAQVMQATNTSVAGANQTSESSIAADAVAGLHGLRAVSVERLSPLRKAVSAKLSRSRSEIPEATVWVDVDFTELWQLRSQMVADGNRPPSITTLVARFVLIALGEYPMLAGRLSEDGSELSVFDGVNLGIAVDSERGLSVPVLPQAERLSINELDAALRELSAEARTGRIAPARLTGSTFTFNNYGGFGVDGSAAIINHPEIAILGMGRVIERPWVVDGEIVARRIAQMSLVFDHRVCDGGYASGFIGRLVEMIEHPLRVYGRL